MQVWDAISGTSLAIFTGHSARLFSGMFSGVDADVVYKVLKGMVANKADLTAIAKAMGSTTPKMMAEDIGVPMHKGAERFYKEIGAL